MAAPKRRTSSMKSKLRRQANRWRAPKLNKCPECGSTTPSHIACPSCGYYRDRQVLSVDSY
ncbi:MAG: 50S ribosomal protein L32 [Verrucomicrobiota bacterium]